MREGLAMSQHSGTFTEADAARLFDERRARVEARRSRQAAANAEAPIRQAMAAVVRRAAEAKGKNDE